MQVFNGNNPLKNMCFNNQFQSIAYYGNKGIFNPVATSSWMVNNYYQITTENVSNFFTNNAVMVTDDDDAVYDKNTHQGVNFTTYKMNKAGETLNLSSKYATNHITVAPALSSTGNTTITFRNAENDNPIVIVEILFIGIGGRGQVKVYSGEFEPVIKDYSIGIGNRVFVSCGFLEGDYNNTKSCTSLVVGLDTSSGEHIPILQRDDWRLPYPIKIDITSNATDNFYGFGIQHIRALKSLKLDV